MSEVSVSKPMVAPDNLPDGFEALGNDVYKIPDALGDALKSKFVELTAIRASMDTLVDLLNARVGMALRDVHAAWANILTPIGLAGETKFVFDDKTGTIYVPPPIEQGPIAALVNGKAAALGISVERFLGIVQSIQLQPDAPHAETPPETVN